MLEFEVERVFPFVLGEMMLLIGVFDILSRLVVVNDPCRKDLILIVVPPCGSSMFAVLELPATFNFCFLSKSLCALL